VAPRIAYLVGRVDRLLRRSLGDALKLHGLSLADYTTLSVLRDRGGLSNAQLARRSLITPQAMNEVLARLERNGLVQRSADPVHGRIRPAALTATGVAALRAADADVDVAERALLRRLSAADRKLLRTLLERIAKQ
jgi:DNA-binding MarR family transcriptional regulator